MLIERTHEPYHKIRNAVLNNDYNGGLAELHKLVYLSVDMKVICQNLHDVFVDSDLEAAQKFKYLRIIGEAEWRSSNMTPKVLASWLIGQMI